MAYGDPPQDNNCPVCGAHYGLVGRAHNCKPTFGQELIQSAKEASEIAKTISVEQISTYSEDFTAGESPAGDVNEVNTPQEAELTPPVKKKRGEYPGTDERRKYMREYMMKKRRGKL